MKVLIIANYPPPFGGVPSEVEIVTNSLSKKGYASHVICYSLFVNPIKKFIKVDENITVHRFDIIDAIIGLIINLPRSLRLIKTFYISNILKTLFHIGINNKILKISIKNKVDIIDAYHIYYPAQHAKIVSDELNLKYIVNIYGEIFRDEKYFSEIRSKLQPIILDANYVLSCSNHCLNSLKKLNLHSTNSKVIYPGIDTNHFQKINFDDAKKQLKKFEFNPKVNYIGYLGRYVEEMGLLVFLDLLTREELKDFNFIAIGASGELSRKLKQIQLKNSRRLKVFENEEHSNLPLLISMCDYLVVPSINERACYGKAIAEGQSCKVPVIASNLGGHIEVIDDMVNGLLFEPNNSKDLCAKIISLESDTTLRENIIKSGFKKSVLYSQDIRGQKSIDTYKQILI